MIHRVSTPTRATLYLFALWCLPNALAIRVCIKDACTSDGGAISVGVIAAIVVGVIILLSVARIIFAIVRCRRMRKSQRSYVQNAQANATGMNMVAPTYPSPAYAPMPHYSLDNLALGHHNRTMEQANIQNQNSMMVTSTTGIGGMSGSTGIMV
ncbi:hypothetical protein DFH09DRAFT_1151319 [Mycena vulgaris]|nr:hypothetical protein DFH09DRAFT_1151319 [Mycena vulgaris]